MIYSSDVKAFAHVWREYDQAVSSLESQIYWEHLHTGRKWYGTPCIGNAILHQEWLAKILPSGHAKPTSVRDRDIIYQGKFTYSELLDMFGESMPQEVVISNQITRYDLWRVRNPEFIALNSMTDAADLWADMLQPLKNIKSHSVPVSFYESGLQEIRSAVYFYTKQSRTSESIEVAWTHKCTAPTELLRLISTRRGELNDAQFTLVLTALAGWLSTKIKRRTDHTDLTEPDLIANMCLAVADCSLFPPIVTHADIYDKEQDTTPLSVIEVAQIISRTHSHYFQGWCRDFFVRSVRQPENSLRRRDNCNEHYGLSSDLEATQAQLINGCSMSNISPSAAFETKSDVRMLMHGLSKEEKAILSLYAEGLTYEEIAERLKANNKAVGMRIVRIKEKAMRNSRKFNITY